MEKNIYLTKDKENVPEVNYRTSWTIYPKILSVVKIREDEKVLDAGCGYGALSRWVKNANLTGLDFRRDLVNNARKESYQKVVLGNIENLKFKNKTFDKSFSIQVFQYLENPEKAFGELVRVTKKQIVITVPNFNWIKIKSIFNKKWKKQYNYCVKNENITNSKFLRKLAKSKKAIVKIYYLSNRFGILRNFLGEFFSSEVMGVYNLK